MMKPWMKALVWLGLGGGIGFFAGMQVGYRQGKKEMADAAQEAENRMKRNILYMVDRHNREMKEKHSEWEEAMDALRQYKGLDDSVISDGQLAMDLWNDDPDKMVSDEQQYMETWKKEHDGDSVQVTEPEEEDEEDIDMDQPPEMPDDLEIEQLHPEDLLPHAITKEEFNANAKGYDRIDLDWYTDDNVIFDPKEEEKWTHPQQLLGIGWNSLFIGKNGKFDIPEVYIENDTMGALYRITRIDDSFEELYEEE